MIESMMGVTYGRVSTEIVYKDGQPVSTKQATTNIIKITSKQILMDAIFDQLRKLQDEDSINFEIFASPHTHEPCRMEITSKSRLD